MYNTGLHIILDGHGCDFDFTYSDMSEIQKFLAEKITEGKMTILGTLFHDFLDPVGAFTGIFLLGESHFSIHTFPEKRYISVDFYVCNYTKDVSQEARSVIQEVIEFFHIQKPSITELIR